MILHVNYFSQSGHSPQRGYLQPGQGARAGEVVTALLGLVDKGRVDVRVLPGLRVHLDWIQYPSSSPSAGAAPRRLRRCRGGRARPDP